MIITLEDTTTGNINKELVRLRAESGVVTVGRVLTLVVDATGADVEAAVASANEASREHPCRVVVLAPADGNGNGGTLDAEIRVGHDAGSGEVVVLRPSGEMAKHGDTLVIPLLLPDAPIVAWWPAAVPDNPVATGIGAMAQRRITDSKGEADAAGTLERLADAYAPGDTDIAWTRLTRWRALLASALEDVPAEEVRCAKVVGETNSPSILLLGAWLRGALGCSFEAQHVEGAAGLAAVVVETSRGDISITRADARNAVFSQPKHPDHAIALPHRGLNDCLAEELRLLDADPVYGRVLAQFKDGLA